MTLGELLLQCWEQIYALWPMRIIGVWEQGVKCRTGNVVKLLTSKNGFRGGGLHFFIPLLEEVHQQDCSTNVLTTGKQTLTCVNGKSVTLSFVVRYRIVNYQKLTETLYEADDSIQAEVTGVAGEYVPLMTPKEVRVRLAEDVYTETRKRFKSWGIDLEAIVLSTFTACPSLRIIGQ